MVLAMIMLALASMEQGRLRNAGCRGSDPFRKQFGTGFQNLKHGHSHWPNKTMAGNLAQGHNFKSGESLVHCSQTVETAEL